VITTMALDETVCIVTAISVQAKKPLGVRVEVETLCGQRTQIRGGELKMHYDIRYPVCTCSMCQSRYADAIV
jgi:hypothetical protein